MIAAGVAREVRVGLGMMAGGVCFGEEGARWRDGGAKERG